jgi:hypothetical protein
MANGSDPAKIEIQLALQDAMTPALQAIARELASTSRKAQESSQAGSGFKNLDSLFSNMTKGLVGPVGLAGAFYAATKALDTFAVSQLQTKNFASDVGLQTERVNQLRTAFKLGGAEVGEANQQISSFTGQLREMAAVPYGSNLFRQLSMTTPALAAHLQQLATTGENWKAMQAAADEYFNPANTAAYRARLETVFNLTKTGFEAIKRAATIESMEAKGELVKVWEFPVDEERKYVQSMTNFERTMENIYKRISHHAITTFNEISSAMGISGDATEIVVTKINTEITKAAKDIGYIMRDLKTAKEWLDSQRGEPKAGEDQKKSELFSTEQLGIPPSTFRLGIGDPRRGLRELQQLPPSAIGKNPLLEMPGYPGAGSGFMPMSLKSGGDTGGDFGEGTKMVRQGVFEALVDFNSYLQGNDASKKAGGFQQASLTTGGGGGTGGAAGGAAVGGAAGPMGGGIAGGGGFGGSRTRAERNNNPGNIKFGEFAKAQGATGADDQGHAIFPNAETGFKAAEALIGGKGYQGLTLGQIGQKWSGGDPGWAQNVSKVTGVGVGDVPTPEQRTQIARQGIPVAEGFRPERAASAAGAAGGGDGSGVPSEILAEARKAALAGGPGAVKAYIEGKGYHVHSAWCGDFAAAVVSGAGGTPPKNPQVASNWRNFGTQVVTPEQGDIAVRRGASTGSTGSHVTVVDAVGRGSFTGLGGNQGRMFSQYPMSRYQFFRGEQSDRFGGVSADESQRQSERLTQAITKMNGSSSGPTGTLNAEVDFKNVPPGVRTSADGVGFKRLKISSSKQGAKVSEGLMAPGDQAYTPWVP